MKPINLLGAATALVMAATPVFAANWVYVTSNKNGTEFYYDADTIQRSGDQITVWEKWDHSRDNTVKDREKKNQFRYDCAKRTYTLLHSVVYYPDGTGSSFTWKTSEQDTDPVVPETPAEAKLKVFCAATAP